MGSFALTPLPTAAAAAAMKRSRVLQNAMDTNATSSNNEPSTAAAGGQRALPKGYITVSLADEAGKTITIAVKSTTDEDAMNAKKRNMLRAISAEGLPPAPPLDPKIIAKYGADLMYLLDKEHFGVRNPNGDFHVLQDDNSNVSLVPARNSWDWDRIRRLNVSSDVRRFIQRVARCKLCQNQGVEVTSRVDFTDIIPPKWKDETFWQEVFTGVYTEGDDVRPLVPYANIPDEECEIDPEIMHDTLYTHLLKSYHSRNGHIECLPKTTLTPDISKTQTTLRTSADLHEAIMGVCYDMIKKLGDCCLTSKQKTNFKDRKNVKGGAGGGKSKGNDGDDNVSIQVTQMTPYKASAFSKTYAGVEIPSNYGFTNPVMSYDNVVIPMTRAAFIRGGITFRKFDTASKSQDSKVPDKFDEVSFNMEEVGKPSLAMEPLTHDEVVVDFAIVVFKMAIESCLSPTHVASVTNKKHGMTYMDTIVSKLTRLLFVPYIPNIDIHIEYPGVFKTGYSGKVRQDFCSIAEWNRLQSKPDMEKNYRLLNRNMFRETGGLCEKTQKYMLKRAFTCVEDCTNANYRASCILSINFPVVKMLHMRIEVGPTIVARTKTLPQAGIQDTVDVSADILSTLKSKIPAPAVAATATAAAGSEDNDDDDGFAALATEEEDALAALAAAAAAAAVAREEESQEEDGPTPAKQQPPPPPVSEEISQMVDKWFEDANIKTEVE